MSAPLVSLREAAEDFNASKCQLRTVVEMHIGNDVSRWELTLDTEWVAYWPDGRRLYDLCLHRDGTPLGTGFDWPPGELWGEGPCDADVIAAVFGINPDARVWTKGSIYDTEDPSAIDT